MPKVNAAERLIIALDVPHDLKNPDSMIDADDARVLVKMLGDTASFLKIGWPLYMAGGQVLIKEFVEQGRRVFLDLKFGDIAETVKRLVHVAVHERVDFITVNTSFDAIRAAVEAAKGSDLKILTVTVLTSLSESDLEEMGQKVSVRGLVLNKARLAQQVGCQGIIASGKEAADIRVQAGPDFLIVTPGIRPSGMPHEDHKRAVTPGDAVRAGADYLVVGRPIARARDPREAALQITSEMQEAFDSR
jgi:orotidine-5'-phosphate decarboxylase